MLFSITRRIASMRILLLIILSSHCSANTIEAIQRGLQERRLAIENQESVIRDIINEMRTEGGGLSAEGRRVLFDRSPQAASGNGTASGGSLIVWPNGVFPADGTVNTLEVAIQILNQASMEFDRIKQFFVPWDGTKPVDSMVREDSNIDNYSKSKIDLPSVGIFTVDNWREKSVLLASSIDALKTLEASAAILSFDNEALGQCWDEQLGATPSYPFLHRPISSAYYIVEQVGVDPNTGDPIYKSFIKPGATDLVNPTIAGWDTHVWPPNKGWDPDTKPIWRDLMKANSLRWDIDPPILEDLAPYPGNEAYTWSLHSVAAGTGIWHLRMKAKPNVTDAQFPELNGTLSLWKTCSGGEGFKLIDALVEENGEAWPVGFYKSLGSGYSNYESNPIDNSLFTPTGFHSGVNQDYFRSGPFMAASLITAAVAFPAYHLEYVRLDNLPPRLPPDPTIEYKTTELYFGAKLVQAAAYFRAAYDVYFMPLVTPQFTPILNAKAKSLGASSGSPGDVDISYSPTPVRICIGRGRTDANQVGYLTVNEVCLGSMILTGAPSQFKFTFEYDFTKFETPFLGERRMQSAAGLEYMKEWRKPRLTEIRSRDCVVKINYNHHYRKTLSFYLPPATDEAEPTVLLKSIVIENPSGTAGAKATKKAIRVKDGRAYSEVERVSMFVNSWLDEKFYLRRGEDPDAWKYESTYEWIYDLTNDETDLTVVERNGSLSQTWTGSYFYTKLSPRHCAMPIPKTLNVDGRQFDFTWDTPDVETENPWSFTLEKVVCTGPDDWAGNGAIVKFAGKGLLERVASLVNGKISAIDFGLVGNVMTKDWSFDGMSYRNVKNTYTKDDNFAVVSSLVEPTTDDFTITETFDSDSMVPWIPQLVSAPGGKTVQRDFTVENDVFSETRVHSVGTTPQLELRTDRDKFGNFLKGEKRIAGVLVESAQSNTKTGWGAPLGLKFLRGNTTGITYHDDENFGIPESYTNSWGVKSKMELDWLGRPVVESDGFFETQTVYTASGTSLTSIMTGPEGFKRVENFSPFGELKSWDETVTNFPVLSKSFTFSPGGQSSYTSGTRSITAKTDTSGMLQDRSNGLGGRGFDQKIGVTGGQLWIEQKVREKDANVGSASRAVRVTYDGIGRVVSVHRPSNQ